MAAHFLETVRAKPAAYLAVALALTAVICAPALANGFAHDGAWIVQIDGKPDGGNPWVRDLHAPWQYWNLEFHADIGTPAGLFRPATMFSFALTRAALGPWLGEAVGQHLVNLLLHLLTTGLVWALARRVGMRPAAAGIAAAVFGLHAIHGEVVAGVISRSELLGASSGLGAILLALPTSAERSVGPGRIFAASTAMFVSLSSKESAVAFLPLLFVAAFAVGRKFDAAAGRPFAPRDLAARALRPSLWIGLPALAVYLALRLRTLGAVAEPPEPYFVMNPLIDAADATRIITATVLWAYGALRMLWPPPLVCDYSARVFTIRDSFGDPLFLLAVVALTAAAAGSVLAARKRPALLLAGACFFGASFVTSNVPFALGAIFAERFYYTPSIGLALLVGHLVDRPRIPRIVIAVVVVWLAANARLLFDRIPDWHDDRSLIMHDVAVQPDSALLQSIAGRLDVSAGNLDAALRSYQRAVEIEPRYATAWQDLGATLLQLDRIDEARVAFGRAIDARWQQKHVRAAALLNLGRLERGLGDRAAAAAALRRAIDAEPSFVPAWAALFELHDEQRRTEGSAAADRLLDGIDARTVPPQVREWFDSLRGGRPPK